MTMVIDGSEGEGGGQILRTSLALAIVTGRAIELVHIRRKRAKAGLLRQHLTAVKAAAEISGAKVNGAHLGSTALHFAPGPVRAGDYGFSIGTAGSAALVLQTVLPPLLLADGPSIVGVEGGTHNSMSPPFDFLAKAFAPLLARLGAKLELELVRPGFYPVGGGQLRARITPPSTWRRLDLLERGPLLERGARALVSKLPRHVAERELAVVRAQLGWTDRDARLRVEELTEPLGPGNVLVLELRSEHVTEVVTGFGEKGTPAETVATHACEEVRRYLEGGAPVGEHLADQLLIPLALAGGGRFRTGPLSLHTTTNIEVIRRFLDVTITTEETAPGVVTVCVERADAPPSADDLA